MVLGSRNFETLPAGSRSHHGVHTGARHYGSSMSKVGKSDIAKGMEMLMNRSVMKGIVDPVERSVALGSDVARKMASLESATGKNVMSVLETLGKRA